MISNDSQLLLPGRWSVFEEAAVDLGYLVRGGLGVDIISRWYESCVRLMEEICDARDG